MPILLLEEYIPICAALQAFANLGRNKFLMHLLPRLRCQPTQDNSWEFCWLFVIHHYKHLRSHCGRQDLFWTPLSGLAWKAGSKTMPFYSLKRLTFPFVQPCKPSWFFGRKNLLPPQKRQPRQDKQGVSLTGMLMHWLRTESFADTQVHMARLKINKYKEVAYPSWMSVTWPTL